MDERKLAELFRDAVPDEVPPPTFAAGDIATKSNRQRVRRNNIVAGSVLGVVLLGGVGVTIGANLGDGSDGGSTVAGSADTASSSNKKLAPYDAEVPGLTGSATSQGDRERDASPNKSFPSQSPEQGGTETGKAGPQTGGTPGGCGQADRELAAALAGELPAAANLPAQPASLNCPAGARGAGFQLRDGDKVGVVSVMYVPAGTNLGTEVPWANSPKGTEVKTAMSTDGDTIVVVSAPQQGEAAPFEGELARVAKDLAARN